MQSLFQIEIIYKPAKDETIVFSRSIPIPQKGSDPLNQTKLLFPLIFISREDDSSIVIPPQPTSPGEIMSGGEGEPVEADAPAKDETVAPQGMHVTGTQTVTHEYLTLNGKVARETISLWFYSLAFRFSSFLLALPYPQQTDISEWFGIATNLAFRDNPCGQEVRGAPSSGWGFRPRSGMYLLSVYSVFKDHEETCFVPQ